MTKISFLLGASVGVIGAVAFMAAHHMGLLSAERVSAAHQTTAAIAVITGTQGNDITGAVKFQEVNGGVRIQAHVNGLAPGKHGFHIHELGDISGADGTSTGGHFNPEGEVHSGPDSDKRHAGDMGNLEANASGQGMKTYVDKQVKLSGPNNVIGRAITIHAGEDDMTSQPTGSAGGRVAVGVIGIAKGEASGSSSPSSG